MRVGKNQPSFFSMSDGRRSDSSRTRYQFVATSPEGFIQQLAVNYVPHGYWFYVTGWVPEGKDASLVDGKLIHKYGIAISRQARARRKLAGFANVHYLRYERFFILIATHGKHLFFDEEKSSVRDIRKCPVKFGGHSISFKKGGYLRRDGEGPPQPDENWHSRVQIAKSQYTELKAHFLHLASRRSAEAIAQELFLLPYEPYAPVRQQILNLLRIVNEARKRAGLDRVPPESIRYQRRIVRPFVEPGSD